jgi:cathepsin L
MAWVLQHGLATEEDVPYLGEDSGCGKAKVLDQNADVSATQGGAEFGLSSWVKLDSNKAYPLAEAVVHYGPVAVSAAASDWFEYSTGIFDSCDQDAVVDHAIVLYGFGVENSVRYWLIRNSWGRDWGEHGYIRLLRHGDGEQYCGTDDNPSEGTGCKGGPPSVPVCGMCGVLFDSVVPHFAGSPSQNSSLLAQSVAIDTKGRMPTADALLRVDEFAQAADPGIEVDGVPSLFRREVRRHD